MIQTGGWWAIDATVFCDAGGKRFLLWSDWEDTDKGAQNLYIAPMRDPLSLGGPRTLLARPAEPWEQRGGVAIIEGPAALQRGGVTCIVYSASLVL